MIENSSKCNKIKIYLKNFTLNRGQQIQTRVSCTHTNKQNAYIKCFIINSVLYFPLSVHTHKYI